MLFEAMSYEVSPLLKAILAHPFQQELADGTLLQERFLEYLRQDALYLSDFSRALALVAARLPTHFSTRFLTLALGAVEAERELHHRYLSAHEAQLSVDKNPACFAYTHYLLSTATLGSVEEAVASLVPCFWIYQVVGAHVAAIAVESNPFHLWIETYASPSFKEAVESIIEVMDTLALSASKETQEKMRAAFYRATALEWLFWDDAYCGSDFAKRIFA